MKKTIIKIFDKIIVLLLLLFGVFSGCDKPVEYGPLPEYGVPVPMYGPPTEVIINDDTSNSAQDILEMNEDNLQAESGL